MESNLQVKAEQGMVSWLATFRILIDYVEQAREWEQTISDSYQQVAGDTGLLNMAIEYTNELEGYFMELVSMNEHQRKGFVLTKMRLFESEH